MAEKIHDGRKKTQQEPVADLRKRFVRRANDLQTHPPFRAALNDAIDGWNEKHPQFPLSKSRGLVPEDVIPDEPGYLYPPALAPYHNPDALFLEDPEIYIPQDREPTEDELLDAAWARPWWDWNHLIKCLCWTWWPLEHFPTWPMGDAHNHPARRFVSACLLWNPDIEADEWIEKRPLEIGRTTHNISGVGEPTPNADEAYFRVLYQETTERLLACVRAGEAITEQVVEREALAAHEVAEHAEMEAVSGLFDRPFYPFVWIWPGMTWKDWRALEPLAVAAAEEQESGASPAHWRVIARRLHAEGMSVKRIALELGVERTTVGRELKEP